MSHKATTTMHPAKHEKEDATMNQAPDTVARTVLVVDDVATNRDLIVTLVHHLGHRTLEAADGAQGLVLARREHPDLIVSDILMPTMDGFAFVSQLRADPALAHTPVIFYTAHYRELEANNLARICGVAHVLLKPCAAARALEVLGQALSTAPGLPSDRPRPPSSASPGMPGTPAQWSDRLRALDASNRRLTALTELNLQMASERDLQHLLELVCHGARDLLSAKFAVLGVAETDQTSARFASCGIAPELLVKAGPPRLQAGLPGQVMLHRVAGRFTNTSGNPADAGLPVQYPPVHKLLIAPVASLACSYGWICLGDKVGADDFSDQDESLLSVLASQVGRIYDNVRLYEKIQQDAVMLQHEIAERTKAQEALRHSAEQLRALSRRIIDTQESERRRVARELHDEVGQALTAIKIRLQTQQGPKHTHGWQAGKRPLHDESLRIVDNALAQMRRLALGLRPSILDDLGLMPALRWLANESMEHHGLKVSVRGRIDRLDPGIETVCFRIAQEAMTNVVRHARATRVTIELLHWPEVLELHIEDDGQGFEVDDQLSRASHGHSLGLLGMRERATLAGGRLEITSTPGHGCTVLLSCPLAVRAVQA